MEYYFSTKQKRSDDSGFEDPFNNVQELMEFDAYAGWGNSSPTNTDNLFAPSTQPSYANFDFINIPQDTFSFPIPDRDNDTKNLYSDEGEMANKQNIVCFQPNNISDTSSCIISRPIIGKSLCEKMVRALSLFKLSSGGGILAQVWVPIKYGNQYVLSTYEQPYLLDHMLEGYREVSRGFTFSAEMTPGSFHGLPGRVFVSKVPEWTSNVGYYNKSEYLRVNHAVDHEVRGSIAIPVFDSSEKSCCAVLELVTVKEKSDFDSEMEDVCHALKAVNLRTTSTPRLQSQSLTKNKKAALAEVMDVLKAICHAHRLPLALTWIPCTQKDGDEFTTVQVKNNNTKTCGNEKTVLCLEETACYITDTKMQGFVHACADHHLEEGQGNAGNALQSNHPFFSSNIKDYNVSSYPLVHHARKYGLNAAVAIRLRSTYTGDDDYVLEFFLPVNMKDSVEQQLLLNNLAGIMQRKCRTLRTVSDSELFQFSGLKSEICTEVLPSIMSTITMSLNETVPGIEITEADNPREEGISRYRRRQEKRKSTTEKTVSLSVLQQYFSGSLKDAAKNIGVCPTTLKRICRQHGISRWPSRKINKVSRSLKKIQSVLESVQGVEGGGFKFDPTTGEIFTGASVSCGLHSENTSLFSAKKPISNVQDSTPTTSLSGDFENFPIKLEDYEFFPDVNRVKPTQKSDSTLMGPVEEYAGLMFSENQNKWGLNCNFWSQNSADDDNMDMKMDFDDGIVEHSLPTSSSMTDSSSGSGSMIHSNESSSPNDSFTKMKTCLSEHGPKITVKARYKEDTIRFKFDPLTGFYHLNEEIAKRFKLQMGMFQLKYLDDEKEWVMLVNDSDLQECVEVLDFMGTRSVKFLLRDMHCEFGSSSSSNCFSAATTQ